MKHNLLLLALSLTLLSCSSDKPGIFFGSCEEVREYYQMKKNTSWAQGDPVAASPEGSSSSDYLNLQEKGVDEADFFRMENKWAFVAHQGGIEVFKRKPFKKLGVLAISELQNLKLYSTPSTLILIGSNYRWETEVRIYLLKENALPTHHKTKVLAGGLIDSRLNEDELVLVMNDLNSVDSFCGTNNPAIDLSGVNCTSIVRPPEGADLYSFNLVKAVSLSLSDLEAPEKSIAFLGGATNIYMSKKHLYVPSYAGAYTHISKVKVSSSELSLLAQGSIEGYIKDRWAFKEYPKENALSVVSSNFNQENFLSTFKEHGPTLEKIASVGPFGLRENIRAVRFVGDMAYAVTFRITDPLFAIDLSNPLAPQMKGELKVPGFSAYLHPYGNNKLIGVGFDASELGVVGGVQLSLFDVKAPLNLNRLDFKTIGERSSFSDPISDAHAFYKDPYSNRIGIPVVQLKHMSSKPQVEFSGAILYEVNNTLKETHRISHASYISPYCKKQLAFGNGWGGANRSYDINRLVQMDGDLFSVSRFALVRHCNHDPHIEEEKFIFSNTEEEANCKAACYSCE